MHLVYFSHSYRPEDDELNKTFERLMVSEGMITSIDPPSDHLNSAKPERHMRSTDGLVCVLPYRDGGPSSYILYEISLAMRARRPLLVFVEDVLPSNIIPSAVLGRRFSRRSLLRQIRDQRHALSIFKDYMGSNPPPNYQPSPAQRSCLIIGVSRLSSIIRKRIHDHILRMKYSPVFAEAGNNCLTSAPPQDEGIVRASFAVAFTEKLSPQEYYCLGAVRAALTPTITLTANPTYAYDPTIPIEYQPRLVDIKSSDSICEAITAEVEIFEQDYLELTDEHQIERYKRYKAIVLNKESINGNYGPFTRSDIINNYNFDMSVNKTQFRDNYGNINIDSLLDNVTQTVNSAGNLNSERRRELSTLVQDLKAALKPVTVSHPEDSNRVVESVELVVKEATKAKPNQSFLKITAEGLKEAASVLKDVAPTVLTIAEKVVKFLVGLDS